MTTAYCDIQEDSPEVALRKKQLVADLASKSVEEVRSIWAAIVARSQSDSIDDEQGEFYSHGITWDWWMEMVYHYAEL